VQGPVQFLVARRVSEYARNFLRDDLMTERVEERESGGFFLNIPRKLFYPFPDLCTSARTVPSSSASL
jgi:hypothetical protein